MIDSRDKRASALREGLLPYPDGATLNAGDRQQVLWQYRSIAAAGVVSTDDHGLFVGVIQGGGGLIMDTSMGVQ